MLVGVLVVVLVARDVPSFLRDNDNLPLIQNFVITPVSSDSEPTVRLARESLAPAVVQSGAGQSAESPPSDAAPSAAALATPTPTPPTQESNTPATESQTQVGSQDTVMHPTETPTTAAMEPADAPTAAVAAAVETSTATPAPAPPETETAAPTATPAWKIYTIKRYDTLEEIARRFEIDLPRLLEANAIAPGEERRLQLGQEIVLPGILGETATPTATATATSATTPTATPQG